LSRHFIVVILSLFSLSCFALDKTETTIIDTLSKAKDEQLQLLMKLVNINSGTENTEGVVAVGEILRKELNAIGFETRWEQPKTTDLKAPTLVAERKGKQGKRLLLIGHLDTVFSKSSPFQNGKISGVHLAGPGAVDMKGGDVIMLYALKALFAAGALDNTSITIILTGDEEDAASPVEVSRAPLIEAAKQTDIALEFESSKTTETLSIARRGITHWHIESTGAQGHSSLIFKEGHGYGANFEMARVLNEMRATMAGEPSLTFNPGILVGGTEATIDSLSNTGKASGKTNVIAKNAISEGDLRFLTNAQKDNAKKNISNIVSQPLLGTTSTVVFEDRMPAMPPTEASLALLNQYSSISESLNYGKVTQFSPDLRGGGDISYIAPYVSACLIGLGAVGTGEHAPEETLDIQSLEIQSKRAALLIYELTR
jgi:glutamate carboxypeptidase